jgi:hypothetical protein
MNSENVVVIEIHIAAIPVDEGAGNGRLIKKRNELTDIICVDRVAEDDAGVIVTELTVQGYTAVEGESLQSGHGFYYTFGTSGGAEQQYPFLL